ncbi:MAG: flagellar hook-basal body complex protein FliE [Methylobacteriaceae bacterium]|nr:flagellar hook-basal body complex protein FliE [Methylobacteriaceae bacterium]MCO5086073.1 flagellar hook-basal body complex protein FliE [Methylobacteriaceae bacterium]
MAPLLVGFGAQSVTRAVSSLFEAAESGQAPSGGTSNFRDMLADLATSASQSVQAAEKVSASALHGKASAREVAETLIQAEQSLQTALAVRDKLVAALQEISRMPI